MIFLKLEMLLSKKVDAAIYSSGEYTSGEAALEKKLWIVKMQIL